MGGEFFRETGVLVIVLAPLELLVTHGRLTTGEVVATLVISGSSLGIGFWLGLEQQ